ncbi:MAG: SAM-dependent methyltransferase [Oscillospiraceae bacterium]|nr:SAM-dependent methyltransferase [Oscillospiraceae bacterium]
MKQSAEFKRIWKAEEERVLQGWDFSCLDVRCESTPLPWDYREQVSAHLRPGSRLLDIATGGGEFLLSLGHPPRLTAVTEDYPPNAALCRERLVPLGITVSQTLDGGRLPFGDGSLDVVINRHGSFRAEEVFRVLSAGGVFITQQAGSENNRELSARLIKGFTPPFPDHNLEGCLDGLQQAGFTELQGEEAFPALRFYDVGALVCFAKAIVWEFPGFSVERDFGRLCACQEELERNGFLQSREHRFLILAKKL